MEPLTKKGTGTSKTRSQSPFCEGLKEKLAATFVAIGPNESLPLFESEFSMSEVPYLVSGWINAAASGSHDSEIPPGW
jgi:hypothetical protein